MNALGPSRWAAPVWQAKEKAGAGRMVTSVLSKRTISPSSIRLRKKRGSSTTGVWRSLHPTAKRAELPIYKNQKRIQATLFRMRKRTAGKGPNRFQDLLQDARGGPDFFLTLLFETGRWDDVIQPREQIDAHRDDSTSQTRLRSPVL